MEEQEGKAMGSGQKRRKLNKLKAGGRRVEKTR